MSKFKSRLTVGVIVTVLLATAAYVYILNPGLSSRHDTVAAGASWTSSTIHPAVPGFPTFDLSYPTEFGPPTVVPDVTDPGKIDGIYNGAEIVFYMPDSPHNFPNAGAQVYLLLAVSASEHPFTQTLDEHVVNQSQHSDVGTIQHTVVDGHPAFRQAVPNGAISNYYIEYDAQTTLQVTLSQALLGASSAEKRQSSETAYELEDRIAKSITFQNG